MYLEELCTTPVWVGLGSSDEGDTAALGDTVQDRILLDSSLQSWWARGTVLAAAICPPATCGFSVRGSLNVCIPTATHKMYNSARFLMTKQ